MKIRITASNPQYNAKGIEHLIGNEYDVVFFDDENDCEVSVIDESFGGEIVLNKNEYEVVG